MLGFSVILLLLSICLNLWSITRFLPAKQIPADSYAGFMHPSAALNGDMKRFLRAACTFTKRGPGGGRPGKRFKGL